MTGEAFPALRDGIAHADFDFDGDSGIRRDGENPVPIGDDAGARSADAPACVGEDSDGRVANGVQEPFCLILGSAEP